MMDLPENGEVQTPWGLKPYILPRITRRNASLVEVAFDDGSSLRCTPEHRFLTEFGWRFAALLVPGSRILSASTRSLKSSRGNSGVSIPKRISISSRAAWGSFIETCGEVLSGRSRPGIISTTATEIAATIGSRIWSAFIPPSTTAKDMRTAGLLAQRLGLLPQTGIALRLAGSGIVARRYDQSRGPSGNGSSWRASSAGSSTWESTARDLLEANSAPSDVKVRRVTSVVPLDERSDVWCLTVPDVGCFALANGAVVANSHPADALRTAAVGLRPVGDKRDKLVPRGVVIV